jgi:hypothetical protein
VSEDSRFKVEVLGGDFYKLSISFGYIENPLLLPAPQNADAAGGRNRHTDLFVKLQQFSWTDSTVTLRAAVELRALHIPPCWE